jgi:hypothetical protein
MTEITVRPLPTAFDPDDGPVTIATPSCCCSSCCCCCCLATVAMAATASMAAPYEVAVAQERRGTTLPAFIGLMSVPAAIAAIALVVSAGIDSVTVVAGAGGIAYVAVMALALWAAGASGDGLSRAAGLGVMFAILFAVLFFVEIVLAIVTAFIAELLAFATLFLGWRMGRWWGAQAIVRPPTVPSAWPPE